MKTWDGNQIRIKVISFEVTSVTPLTRGRPQREQLAAETDRLHKYSYLHPNTHTHTERAQTHTQKRSGRTHSLLYNFKFPEISKQQAESKQQHTCRHTPGVYFRQIHKMCGIYLSKYRWTSAAKMFHIKRGSAEDCGFLDNQFFLMAHGRTVVHILRSGVSYNQFLVASWVKLWHQSKILGPSLCHFLDPFIPASQLKVWH